MEKDTSIKAIGPDCLNCWRRNICPQMEEGKFCGKWQSKEPSPHPSPSATPSPQGEGWDPSEAWNRGDSDMFYM